jgi:hypothetical protein
MAPAYRRVQWVRRIASRNAIDATFGHNPIKDLFPKPESIYQSFTTPKPLQHNVSVINGL